jgi:hypothetical protein
VRISSLWPVALPAIALALLLNLLVAPAPTAGRSSQVREQAGSPRVDVARTSAAPLESAQQLAATFTVDPAVHYYPPDGANAERVVVGHVIGDSRPDIVVTTMGLAGWSADVLIYEQKPDGTLARPVTLMTVVDGTATRTGLELIDLDYDGRNEIVVGHDKGLVVLRYNGTSFTRTPIESALELQYLSALDADGDGNTDIFAQRAQEGAEIHFGDGTGGFNRKAPMATSVSGYNTVEVRDFTGDGYQDLILTNGQGWSKVWVYPNNPGSGLKPAKVFDFSALLHYPPQGLAVADFNGDRKPDLALSDSGDQTNANTGVRIVYQDANGALVGPRLLPTWTAPGAIAAGDLDGNGLADVVTLYSSFNTMAYMLQQPTGFQAAVTLPTQPPTYTYNSFYEDNSLVVADVNSDRCLDIVVADMNYGMLVFAGRNCKPRMVRTGGNLPPLPSGSGTLSAMSAAPALRAVVAPSTSSLPRERRQASRAER